MDWRTALGGGLLVLGVGMAANALPARWRSVALGGAVPSAVR